MEVFLLEDDNNRIEWFQVKFGKENVFFTDSPIIGLAELEKKDFDMIFLDHDLGGGPYLRGKDGDGIDLTKKMAEKKLAVDVPVIIHSLNIAGAIAMEETLSETHKSVNRVDFRSLQYKLGGCLQDLINKREK